MSETTVSEAATTARSVLSSFVAELGERLTTTHQLEDVLRGEDTLTSADVGQRPETFTENNLIYPLLEAMGLENEEQPFGEAGDRVVWPDFAVTNLSTDVIGENKPVNNVEEAVSEIKDYLDRKSIAADYGIVTDGITWSIYKIELGGDVTEYPEVATVNLRPALVELARERGLLGSTSVSDVNIEEFVTDFTSVFEYDELEPLLSETAPREIRDERKRDVEEFYELYIELLFGESDEYDYDTSVMDDIRSPAGATERDERLFAITLMNRLLFIKFLETRDILEEGFLRRRVEEYESNRDHIAGSLYETQIKPIFYDLLNTPNAERAPKHQRGWFEEVPFLNGGLFRENIDRERHYTVIDRTLPTVISDLIEGSELELNGEGFDPAVLGSVFEKTINHIEQERTQKDIGAYYTPNDVTNVVLRGAVDPKIKSELVDAFVDAAASDDEERDFLRGNMEEEDLSEILRRIENGEGFYGMPEAIEAAFEALTELKVIDPACGSGHFLTSAMDEMYRALISLLRGLNAGEDPDPADRYEVKKDLALNAIYGVDVDRIATEIAKLRVWLKIVQGNSWEPGFGRLPNIDVNIAAGNSLVGLPVKGTVETISIWDDRIEEYAEMRRRYKYEDEGDRRDIEQYMEEEIRPHVDAAFLDRLTHSHETEIDSVEEFDTVIRSIDSATLYPTIESVQAVREDDEPFTDEDESRLEEASFTVYTRSARVNIEDRETDLKNSGEDGVKETVVEELRGLVDDHFEFSEVTRQPLAVDLEGILGRPFHWPVEFPEVAEVEGSEPTIHFDLVLGNPPYGHITSESEEILTATYRMAGTDIAAPFVERQIQLLTESGDFGNVTTLKLVYKAQMEDMQDVWRDNLETTRVACFAKRPSKVFEGAEVRVGIITGEKSTDGTGDLLTSEFIRFDNEKDRNQRFRDIQYRNINGYTLRQDGINGDGRHIAIPKIGLEHIETVLETIRDQDSLIDEREVNSETPHVIWRRRGMDYFTNPMLEQLYDATDIYPLYFEDELEARTAFLAVSSSIFYVYWCAYGDMFHLNLSEIRAFPLPPHDELEERREEIMDISDRLWSTMEAGFNSGNNTFDNYEHQKPIIEEVDAVLGQLYGLPEETIAFCQDYHSEYGRHGPADESLDSF